MSRASRVNIAALVVVVLLSIAIAVTGNLDNLAMLSAVSLATWIDSRLAAVLAGLAASRGK